jgi:hypothetical protein
LVLRKGRTIRVALGYSINSEVSSEDVNPFTIMENIYDDSGQFLLMPKNAIIQGLYKISSTQDKIKINITAMEMFLDRRCDVSVLFSEPPRCTTISDRKALLEKSLSSADVRNREEEFLRLRERLLASPVISAELTFGTDHEDRASMSNRITFGESTSGDRTIVIIRGYRIDLQVKKDILFSEPYIRRR